MAINKPAIAAGPTEWRQRESNSPWMNRWQPGFFYYEYSEETQQRYRRFVEPRREGDIYIFWNNNSGGLPIPEMNIGVPIVYVNGVGQEYTVLEWRRVKTSVARHGYSGKRYDALAGKGAEITRE